MPKKTASARGAAQRNKPKVQKNIELVRPTTASDDVALVTTSDAAEVASTPVATSVDTMAAPTTRSATSVRKRSTAKISESSPTTPSTQKEDQPAPEPVAAAVAPTSSATKTTADAPKSAAARLAARRQANQKSTRAAITLITAEHYSYVRRDLVFIAVLASVMFAAIIVLHFIPGIGS